MSLKMAHKVILPPKKNYIPQFLKQRDINSYYTPMHDCRIMLIWHIVQCIAVWVLVKVLLNAELS
jgi:hypothetical protein